MSSLLSEQSTSTQLPSSPEVFSQAAVVMKELLSHPITQTLHEPDYEETGLFLVKRRLKEQYYGNIFEWIFEVEEMIYCYEQGSTNEFELFAASETRRLFNKLRRGIYPLNGSQWSRMVNSNRLRLEHLLSSPPGRSSPFVLQQSKFDSLKSHVLKSIGHDLQVFMNATEVLRSREEQDGILRIVRDSQPGLVVDDQISVDHYDVLSASTLLKVRAFCEQCLSKRGLEFSRSNDSEQT